MPATCRRPSARLSWKVGRTGPTQPQPRHLAWWLGRCPWAGLRVVSVSQSCCCMWEACVIPAQAGTGRPEGPYLAGRAGRGRAAPGQAGGRPFPSARRCGSLVP